MKRTISVLTIVCVVCFARATFSKDYELKDLVQEVTAQVQQAEKELASARKALRKAQSDSSTANAELAAADAAPVVAQRFANDAQRLANNAQARLTHARNAHVSLATPLNRSRLTDAEEAANIAFHAAKAATVAAFDDYIAPPGGDAAKKKVWEDAKQVEADAQKKLNKAEAALDKYDAEVVAAEAEVVAAQKDFDAAKAAAAKAMGVATKATQDRDRAEVKATRAENVVKAAKAKVKKAEEALLNAQKEAVIPQAVSKLLAASAQNARFQAAVRSAFITLRSDVDSLKDRLAKVEQAQKNVMQKLSEFSGVKASSEAEAKALAMIANSLQKSLQNFHDGIKKLKEEQVTLQTKIQTLEQAKTSSVQVATADQIQRLEQQISEAQAEIGSKSSEIDTKLAKIENFADEIVRKSDLNGKFGLEKKMVRHGCGGYYTNEWHYVSLLDS